MRILALALLLPGAALAQTQQYLPQASIAASQARSAVQCTALACDGVATKYWWQTVALQDKTAALAIEAAVPFGATSTNGVTKATAGLSPEEQAALVPYSMMCSEKLLAWCIPQTMFMARFSKPAIAKLDAAPAPCGTDWAAIKINAVTDLQVAGAPLAAACTAQGLDYNWQVLLAPMPVEVVPP